MGRDWAQEFLESFNRACQKAREKQFSVERLEQESKELTLNPCVVCGETTDSEFFGVPLCDPYDDNGHVIKKCKWIYRDGDESHIL